MANSSLLDLYNVGMNREQVGGDYPKPGHDLIDRMTMLLADQDTLRDVILFPAMRNLPRAGDTVTQEPEPEPAAVDA